MMILAKSYRLNLIDYNLPAGTADQGMDLLLIAKDLESEYNTCHSNLRAYFLY